MPFQLIKHLTPRKGIQKGGDVGIISRSTYLPKDISKSYLFPRCILTHCKLNNQHMCNGYPNPISNNNIEQNLFIKEFAQFFFK